MNVFSIPIGKKTGRYANGIGRRGKNAPCCHVNAEQTQKSYQLIAG